ncbi:probable serine/threonine-protein kinase DDB_G0282963 [Cydia fagiglandana]|uniref:probable serine/threonine-protein kinase DDB_G0282963 n=1 Tax=Cydia fagiglandana TaxID=1458189 RepID=UPI002FEE6536
MDEDLILREIVKSLAFEIEAVNQDNVLTWTTTNGTPLNVKVRVRNKDEPRLIQKGVIPVPRIGITAPEKLRLISSDQTILSFNVYLDGETEKGSKRHNGLKLFNIGGCLDPPFDEPNYAYGLPKADRPENLQVECNKIDDNKDACEPGGCLDPPFSEDKYPYTISKTHQPMKLELTPQSTKEEQQILSNKSSEERRKTPDKKTIKEEDDSKKLMDIYATTPKQNSLEAKYSHSIITYPTDVSSNETLSDQIPPKKLSIKSNDDESQKQSYDYPVSYFVPPKDVLRCKEEERRYSTRPSSLTIGKSSNSTAHAKIDMVDKSKSMEHDFSPQYVTPSKDIQKEKMKPNYADDATFKNDYNKQSDIVGIEQENTSNVNIPSYVATNSKNVGSNQNSLDKEHASKYLRTTESNPNNNENDIISQQQIVSPIDNQKLYYEKTRYPKENIGKENVKTKEDNPIVERAEIGSKDPLKDTLHQSEVGYITGTQTADSLDAKKDVPDINLTKQSTLKTENSKFLNTHGPIKDDNKLNFGSNDDTSKIFRVAEATIPVLATATLALSKKQSLQFNDKSNIGLDSSVTNKNKASMSKCSEDLLKKSTKQKLEIHENEPKNLSPQSISSSENNEFDVSSEHSIDFKEEFSNNVETRNPENTLGHKEKHELFAENMNFASTNNVIVGKNIPKHDYIKSDPESEKRRSSAILQKKALSAKHDLDMEYDDINKTAPHKRNTFTVIASDTSIQKCEEIEEIPENITDVYFKTTDVSKLNSPNLTKNNTVKSITDINNRKLEGSTPRDSQPGNVKDLHSKDSDDTKATKIDSRTKELESAFYTDADGSLSQIHSENFTNMNNTINQTKPNLISNENEINTDPLRNRLPTHVKDIDTNISETVQSPLKIEIKTENKNANYKEMELLHQPENTQDYLISENAKSLDKGTKDMERPIESINDSLQKTIPDNIQHLHPKDSVSGESAVNQKTANLFLAKRESEKILNTDSNISVPKTNTDNLRSKMSTDSKFVADLTTENLPENARDWHPEINLDDNSASLTKNIEQLERMGIKDIILKHGNKPISGDMYASQNLLANNFHTENGKYFSADSASDRIEVVNRYDNSNGNKPELIQNLNDKKEQKNFDYEELEKKTEKEKRVLT